MLANTPHRLVFSPRNTGRDLLGGGRRVFAKCFVWLGWLLPFVELKAESTFSNTTSITIPDEGAATPYPSVINVSGVSGTITTVTVTLTNFSHTWASDVDVLLVGPAGQRALIMSDVGSAFPATNVTITLSDAAASVLPASGSFPDGTYKPTDYTDDSPDGDNFPAPAPTPPYSTLLSAFNGTNPNGAWSLYVRDDGPGDQGSIAGGWSLSITATAAGPLSPTISDILNQTVLINTSTGAIPFTVADPDTPVANLTLSKSSNNTTLVPNNNIVFGGSGANRTVTVTPAANQSGTATITVTVSDGTNSASDSFILTVDGPPTISNIPDHATNEDTSTGAIAFTVGDAETPVGSLTVSGSSNNTTLVPNANIVFGGSGANRTVTITPAANQNGNATITVTVNDGQLSTSDTFVLTVNPVNDPPTISDIPNQTINVNGTTGPLGFTVGDLETAAGSLTMSGSSNNTTLVPNANIVFGGSGANRTVTVTPATGQTGSATITATVSDGQLTGSDTFIVTVIVNSPPTIQPIANQTAYIDQPTIIKLEVADAQTPVTDLQLSLVTDNSTLIKPEDYEFHWFNLDNHRYLTIAGAFGQTGSANLTVTVSDGQFSANTSFTLTVLPPPAGTVRFVNLTPITLPNLGQASIYPSTINVSGMPGTITRLELTVSRFSHEYPDDLNMLLVSPAGVAVEFMAHVGGGNATTNVTFTVSDSALFPFSDTFQIWSEVFAPTIFPPSDTFPAPAPARPYAPVAFSSFNGGTANGAWKLFIYDDVSPDHGQIAGGWSLLITTLNGTPTPTPTPSPSTPTPTPTPTATPTPSPVSISGVISYCSNPLAPVVPGVTLNLTGDVTLSVQSDVSGAYQFSSLAHGGNYTVTPTKAALIPGSTGIDTVDAIGTQRQFLGLGTPLSGCRLAAANVNGIGGVDTVDVIALQRFFLGFSTGIANAGKYQFAPVSRNYSPLNTNQTAQNYDTFIYGDVTTSFVHLHEGPSEAVTTSTSTSREPLPSVNAVSLPNALLSESSNLIVPVTTSPIDPESNVVGFQGDIIFDERVVTFQSEPVQKAQLTSGNWNVSGNVLPGRGPMRTLRISAFSNDFVPLSGEGTLFELRLDRVGSGSQAAQLVWAPAPGEFLFIDSDLNAHRPITAVPGGVRGSAR